MAWMLKLEGKNIKIVITTIFYVTPWKIFLKENILFLEIKTSISEKKYPD